MRNFSFYDTVYTVELCFLKLFFVHLFYIQLAHRHGEPLAARVGFTKGKLYAWHYTTVDHTTRQKHRERAIDKAEGCTEADGGSPASRFRGHGGGSADGPVAESGGLFDPTKRGKALSKTKLEAVKAKDKGGSTVVACIFAAYTKLLV